MSAEDPVIQNISPEMLYSKPNGANFYLLPEYAEKLTKFHHAEPRTWKTLICIIKSFLYSEGNIGGMTFLEENRLLILCISVPFFNCLLFLQSPGLPYTRRLREAMLWHR